MVGTSLALPLVTTPTLVQPELMVVSFGRLHSGTHGRSKDKHQQLKRRCNS
jgi:hypothetical protein